MFNHFGTEDPLEDVLARWSPPLLVAYQYPSAACGPKALGVEEVRIVHRCALHPARSVLVGCSAVAGARA